MGPRIAAYLIDVIPAVVVGAAAGWIPIAGRAIAGFLLLAYWLLRDVTGSSLGKAVIGLQVVEDDGSPSAAMARILRNVPIAIGPATMLVPSAGYATALPIAGILILAEAVFLLAMKERLGDMLAGTRVVKSKNPS